MKNLIFCGLIFLSFTSLTVFGQNNSGIDGSWLGTLDVSGMKLRLVLKVSKTADGTLSAKLDSPDQGATDLPVDSVVQKDKTVSFSAAKFGISYEGTLGEKGDEIAGTFKQGANSLPLVFRRTGEIEKPRRPQTPQKPFPYREEEVSYKNAGDDVKLAGTLTLPPGDAKYPAVILITGSGAQDRDETIFAHKPFLVLADYLTRRGIAVLRVDDRGVGGSERGSTSATSENFAGDVLAGIEFLKSRREIDVRKIGLIGHSEGGMIAPMVAARSKDVAFIVLLAGPGQTGEDVIYTQTALLQKAEGASAFITTETTKAMKNALAILKSEPDGKLAAERINESLAKQTSGFTEAQKKEFEPVEKTIKSQIPMYVSQWFRYFAAFDPRPTLERVKVPVLALNGANDLQVAPKENLDLIAAALKSGGNKDVTVLSFSKLNHLFQTSEKGTLGEYQTIEETIAPTVLETISNWILKHAK
ncbi:MAG TPA: alpha/beta fold hydrolase [Pyrinomonadaceae bacterium]|jgi:pimeloyl-ACP methyl ester carboxylesterase